MSGTSLEIGLAFDLRSDFAVAPGAPDDALEEYDSRETVDLLVEALRSLGHRPRLLGGGRAFLEAMLASPPQLVFNLAEGRGARGREAQVPAVCEMLGVPCTHSDAATLALCLDKALAKRIVAGDGVRTPAARVVSTPEDLAAIDLSFPLFAKPLGEGSSMGVRQHSRVADAAALKREVERCWRGYGQAVLVEEFLPGVEVTAGVRGPASSPRMIGLMEVAPASGAVEDFVYGLESKREFEERVRYFAPPRSLTPAQCRDAEQSALSAYRALGCRDVARIDLRFDADGRANFIEANPLPGIGCNGDLVYLAVRLGISHGELVGMIVDEAVGRITSS